MSATEPPTAALPDDAAANEGLRRELRAAGMDPARVLTLLDDYHDGFVARFGKKPAIVPGKDAKLLKDLAAQVGDDAVRRMLVERDANTVVTAPGWFFRSPSRFIQSTGYSVGVFISVFNELQLTDRPPKDAASTEAHLRLRLELKARGEAKRTEYEQQTRELLVKGDPSLVERVRDEVIADFKARFPGIAAAMTPDRWAQSVKGSMVSSIVEAAFREHKTPADILATYAARGRAGDQSSRRAS